MKISHDSFATEDNDMSYTKLEHKSTLKLRDERG
jgi:hypothetical protein